MPGSRHSVSPACSAPSSADLRQRSAVQLARRRRGNDPVVGAAGAGAAAAAPPLPARRWRSRPPSEPDRSRHVQRPRAQALLVPAAEDDRREAHPRVLRPHVEGADALGPVDLVRRHGRQVARASPRRRTGSSRSPDARRCGRGRRAPGRLRRSPPIGWIVPISLLASISVDEDRPLRERPAHLRAPKSARTRPPAGTSPRNLPLRAPRRCRARPGARSAPVMTWFLLTGTSAPRRGSPGCRTPSPRT